MKKEVIIAFIIGVIIASSITVYATGYLASQVTYKDGKTVENALNELYNRTNKTAQQVATITTQGGSYTFENDGYILGTVTGNNSTTWANVYFNGEHRLVAIGMTMDASLYVKAGTVVSTREDFGIYNLICYEWK